MFKKAIPVWKPITEPKERLNNHLVFTQTVSAAKSRTLRITSFNFYKLYINNAFAGFGPARTAYGYARVDEYDLSLYEGDVTLRIEAAGYGCCSLATAFQPSYLLAEVEADGEIVAYTGRDFSCTEHPGRIAKTERFSIQRHFTEVYDERRTEAVPVVTVPVDTNLKFLPRSVPMAYCAVSDTEDYCSKGTYTVVDDPNAKNIAYSIDMDAEPDWGKFEEDEVPYKPFRVITHAKSIKTAEGGKLPVTVRAGEWVMADLNAIHAGFLCWNGTANEDTDVIVAFTEHCEDGIFSFTNVNMHTVIEHLIPAGKQLDFESYEPYTFKNIAFFVKQGSLTVEGIGLRTFERDMSEAKRPNFKHPTMNKVYDTALRTFAHNAVDLYTDCPSRERAGWLCDSYFSGKAEYFFFGKTPIEDAFLENYLCYENRGEFPEGILPMCYPSDPHQNNKFIPQWDLWYVLEVCEYLTERNPGMDKEKFRPSVMGILNFFAKYENELGLVEKLPSWNFIEWSSANTWVQDVNYPTNMLYAGALDAVSKTFDMPQLLEKANRIRKTTIALSFNGEVFTDNAIRDENGKLVNTGNISEANQYYAILYGGFSLEEERFAKLKAHVVNGFKGFAVEKGEFCPINAFIGLYLRMIVLLEMGDPKLLAENLDEYFVGMCDETGTLWEHRSGSGSRDHGFASIAALMIPLADQLRWREAD